MFLSVLPILLQMEFGISLAELAGLFIGAIISNASFIFLVPFDFVVFGFPALTGIHPVIIGIVAGIGAAIGEMTSYVIGLGGAKAFEKIKNADVFKLEEIKKRLKDKWAMPIIFLGALTPFPFDIIGLAAGAVKYDVKKFYLAAALGKITRYTIVAYAGLVGVNWFTQALVGLAV